MSVLVDPSPYRVLGRSGHVEFVLARTEAPWELPIDALVVSVGDGLARWPRPLCGGSPPSTRRR